MMAAPWRVIMVISFILAALTLGVAVSSSGPEFPAAPAQPPLAGTYWLATELTGQAIPAQEPARAAHLVFEDGGRVSGSDGCNRISGRYEVKGQALSFGPLAATQMACPDVGDTDRAFREMLQRVATWTISGDRLELADRTGTRVGRFTAQASTPAARPDAAHPLQGTSWQLVEFEGGDGTTLTPDDRLKYTLEFQDNGRLATRIDCNRGSGTWTTSGPAGLTFGRLR